MLLCVLPIISTWLNSFAEVFLHLVLGHQKRISTNEKNYSFLTFSCARRCYIGCSEWRNLGISSLSQCLALNVTILFWLIGSAHWCHSGYRNNQPHLCIWDLMHRTDFMSITITSSKVQTHGYHRGEKLLVIFYTKFPCCQRFYYVYSHICAQLW